MLNDKLDRNLDAGCLVCRLDLGNKQQREAPIKAGSCPALGGSPRTAAARNRDLS